MRKLVVLLAVACAHAPPPAVVAQPAVRPAPPRLLDLPPALLYKESRELMAQGSWEGARERIDAYLKREPKSALALFDAGFIAEKLGDARAAEDFYRRALDSDPGSASAALNLSRLLQLEEKWGDAEGVLESALEKTGTERRGSAPGRAEAEGRSIGNHQLLNALAAVLRAEKKPDQAEAAAKAVLVRHPRDADAYRNLAAVEADRGHVRLAESALNNARKLDDRNAGILNSLGLLAIKRDDVGAARALFEQAAELDPGFAPAFANLGALSLAYRDYPAAEQAYAKAVHLDGSRWDTHLAHGWALEGLRKAKDARGEYERVLALRPGQEDALYGKALALKAENDLPGAMQAFKEYVANSKAAHLKEAQSQVAAIDLRLKNPPATAKSGGRSAAAGTDLSKLPQGTDTAPSSETLPAEEGVPR